MTRMAARKGRLRLWISISGFEFRGALQLSAAKMLRSRSFRDAEIPPVIFWSHRAKESAEWWNMINDQNREWTESPKHQES